MGEIVLQCVSDLRDDRAEMLNVILRLGKSIVDDIDYESSIVEPLNTRAYHACVHYFLKMLALLDEEVISKYKSEILEERWDTKLARSDNHLDLGAGEREQFIIGISEASIRSVRDGLLWEIKNEHESVLTSMDTNLDKYDTYPILEVQKSYRVEFIEGVLRAKDIMLSDVYEGITDLSDLLGEEEIVNVSALIENTRRIRNCGICEAVVESAFRILDEWCRK